MRESFTHTRNPLALAIAGRRLCAEVYTIRSSMRAIHERKQTRPWDTVWRGRPFRQASKSTSS